MKKKRVGQKGGVASNSKVDFRGFQEAQGEGDEGEGTRE